MKSLIVPILSGLLFFSSCEKGIDRVSVPAPVKVAFAVKYPEPSEVEWKNRHSKYVAKFERNGEEVEAAFSADGTFLGEEE